MGLALADFDRFFQTFLVVEDTRLALVDPEPAVPGLLELPDVEDELLLLFSLFLDAVVEALVLEALALDDADSVWGKELLVEVDPLLVRDEEALFFVAVFAECDLVVEVPDPLKLRSALAPASLTASAPSETASPIDFMTWPTSRLAPLADLFTVFTTAPAAPTTGSVTRSRVPFRFLDCLMVTSSKRSQDSTFSMSQAVLVAIDKSAEHAMKDCLRQID